MFHLKIRIHIPVQSHKGVENTAIKYVSLEIFSVWNQRLQKRTCALATPFSIHFNLGLLQGACSQETPYGFVG